DIKKGPWKPEEDQVLINHVKKYGPRDWSSIRSKGLLKRTGKSCRLRWVNKLRPDLKNGVKFSPEEEKTVLELQAQFGNRWAKIATYLTGRTDNDVKNFWSSRQKRIARMQGGTTSPPSPNKTATSAKETKLSVVHDVSPSEAVKFLCSSTTTDEESVITMPRQLLPLPPLGNPISRCYGSSSFFPLELSYESKPQFFVEQPQSFFPRPQHPLLDFFGNYSEPTLSGTAFLPQLPDEAAALGGGMMDSSFQSENVDDAFLDEFPLMDLFDEIEPLPSPSKW
ncbi:hypothetical protein M569_10120, partial [Genlisea aurea]